jgi:hypothetical protein
MAGHTEYAFETAIEYGLIGGGFSRGDPKSFDPATALFPDEVIGFNPLDEEVMWEACLPVFKIDWRREELVRQLAELGIEVAVERTVRGLLKLDNRVQERASIDAIPESDLKTAAISHHDALRKLDDEHDKALLACRDTMQPYWDAEDEGRRICHEYLLGEAQRRRAEGQRVNPFHLIRQFPVWR